MSSSPPSAPRLLRDCAPIEIEFAEGFPVRLRPFNSDDGERAQRAYAQLSPESRLNRFWHNTIELSPERTAQLTDTDDTDHVGWAALPPDEDDPDQPGYAGASFWREEPGGKRAEFAITVLDDWQRQGFGALLFSVLWFDAWEGGVREFVGYARRQNEAMGQWWTQVGGEVIEDGRQLKLRIDLEDPRAFLDRISYDVHAGGVAGEVAEWFRQWIALTEDHGKD